MADFLDEAVGAQALEQARGAAGGGGGQMGTQVGGAKAADRPFASGESEKEPVVVLEEQIEAAEGAAAVAYPLSRTGWAILSMAWRAASGLSMLAMKAS
jgi:hypothetical protein